MAGHYNRPDVFTLHVNTTAPELYRRVESSDKWRAAPAEPSVASAGADFIPLPASRADQPD
jgi:hypothetical protein